MRGDSFKIIQKGEEKLLIINEQSQLLFCRVLKTTNVNELISDDMSQYSYFK